MVKVAGLVGFATASMSWSMPWLDATLPTEQRVELLIANLTTEQKINFMHGKFTGNPLSASGYTGFVDGIADLGIPDIKMNDGPQGFRSDKNPGTSTNWPACGTIGMTWDEELARKWGEAMGREFFDKGANVHLGPGLNVVRVPWNGRAFEYISGEDPFLGAKLAPPVIQGIQSQGVVANAKHWVDNSQETHRGTIGPAVNEVVDERTQWELYYPPFAAAVKAGVGSFMCAYNKINGEPACGSASTLRQDLKGRMGFKGWVMSDWLATHGIAVREGLDQEMPAPMHYNKAAMKKAMRAGKVSEEMLNDSVTRIFTSMMEVGAFEHMTLNTPEKNVTRLEHTALARELSAAATVLLKNEGDLLPISKKTQRLAVIGAQAKDPIIGGSGSGFVQPSAVSAPYDVLLARFAGDVSFGDETDQSAAVAAAAAADIAVVFVGQNSGEGKERASLSLPQEQEELIRAVAKAQPNIVVVMASPGPMVTPWRDAVASILVPFMPGQQFGEAISDILLGHVNPSARLTHTLPNIWNEINMTKSQWPGVGGFAGFGLTATYSEKLEVGYRWYHAHGVKPAYAFGHGLSFTSFDYSGLSIEKNAVSFDVENVGQREGAEVAQLYLTFPEASQEPPRQLKGFKKIALEPGQKETITLQLSAEDLSIWDVPAHDWSVQQGTFLVEVGASSADLRLSQELHPASVLV